MGNISGMKTNKYKKILLVEDNPDLRNATADLLATLGYQVLSARDASEAIESVRKESLDLALVNAYPLEGTGLGTVDVIRTVAPDLPALLVSGFGDDLELRRRVLAGNITFLPIPFSPKALEAKIEEALEQKPERTRGVPVDRQERVPSGLASARPGRPGRSRPYLAAAAVVLAAGLAFQLGDRTPRMPDPDLSEIRRGHTIELLEPVGALDEAPTRLAWREALGSVRYRVILSTVDDTTIWQAETRETSIALPGYLSARLHPAVSYFWQVEGLAEDFSRTGTSTLVAFRFGVPGPA